MLMGQLTMSATELSGIADCISNKTAWWSHAGDCAAVCACAGRGGRAAGQGRRVQPPVASPAAAGAMGPPAEGWDCADVCGSATMSSFLLMLAVPMSKIMYETGIGECRSPHTANFAFSVC